MHTTVFLIPILLHFQVLPESYDFSLFDKKINDAISNKQKFSFGIMQICGAVVR